MRAWEFQQVSRGHHRLHGMCMFLHFEMFKWGERAGQALQGIHPKASILNSFPN